MKVLLILFRPEERDSGTVALDICRNARRFGLDVAVAAFDPGALEEEFELHASAFYRLESEGSLDLNGAYRLRNIIREREIDVVHAFGIGEAFLARIASIAGGPVRRVLHLQDQQFDKADVSERFGLRSAARISHAVLLPSRTAFAMLRDSGIDTRKNFFFVPPGIDRNRLVSRGRTLRSELGLTDDHILMGMKAPFDDSSGIDQITICRALPKVLDKHENVRFAFAGLVGKGGEFMLAECAELCDESGIGDRVFFIADREDSDRVLSSMDLFVYSADNGSAPLAVAEAMMLGLPSVVSDTDLLAEMTDGGRRAEVFVRGDEEELANKILSLIKSRKLREKRAKEAREFAEKNYSIDQMMMSLKTLWSELGN
ncbi:MAG: glycosyltransferase family 4 protein [Acidobacteriota bacterium]|nr:MAG: glycosyltransferase family 4 protein [Acidobacteriota bacterium]